MTSLEASQTELWTSADAAAADRHTMDVLGIPSAVLMERAALSASAEAEALLDSCGATEVVVLCGPGNNGGDGLAVARQLHGRGVAVRAFVVVPAHGETVARQLAWARSHGVQVEIGLPRGTSPRALVVDALLGTGSRGGPRGAVEAALSWDTTSECLARLAIDLPTGVDPDRGSVVTHAFRADRTVTFARSKPGLHVTPGLEHAGQVVVADIGIVAPPERARSDKMLVTPNFAARTLAGLGPAAHKGQRGHVCIVGGTAGFVGAAVLAGTSALRAGAGLVTIRSPAADAAGLVLARPELMLADPTSDQLPGDVLVVGPGLVDAKEREAQARVTADDPRPSVWDASGLESLPRRGAGAGPRVVTPHPGEAARLLSRLEGQDVTVADVQGDRLGAAHRLALATGATVVLKGAGSIVAERERIAIVCSGSSALATAGTGDVLAGAIAAFLGRGLDAFTAARLAAHLHGICGERSRVGVLAEELADSLMELAATRDVLALTPSRWSRVHAG